LLGGHAARNPHVGNPSRVAGARVIQQSAGGFVGFRTTKPFDALRLDPRANWPHILGFTRRIRLLCEPAMFSTGISITDCNLDCSKYHEQTQGQPSGTHFDRRLPAHCAWRHCCLPPRGRHDNHQYPSRCRAVIQFRPVMSQRTNIEFRHVRSDRAPPRSPEHPQLSVFCTSGYAYAAALNVGSGGGSFTTSRGTIANGGKHFNYQPVSGFSARSQGLGRRIRLDITVSGTGIRALLAANTTSRCTAKSPIASR